jgi:uncharacterized membrane protein
MFVKTTTEKISTHFFLSFSFLGGLVTSMHFFGFFLMNWEKTRSFFEVLTPLNLLVSAFALFFFHQSWDKKALMACGVVFLAGLIIEIVGVQTGLLFGKYEYDYALGIGIFGVPLMIGVNWLVLLYATSSLVARWKLPIWLKAFSPAVLMTSLDYLIEPVAIEHHFWHWFGAPVPFSNYRDWFIASYFLGLFFFWAGVPKPNKMAYIILLAQLFFFGAHWIM